MSNLGRRLARLEALHGKGPQRAPSAEEYMAADARRRERSNAALIEVMEDSKAGRPPPSRVKPTPEELRDESIIRRWRQSMGFPWPEPVPSVEELAQQIDRLRKLWLTPAKRASELGQRVLDRMLETLKPKLH